MSWKKYLPGNGYWTGRSNLYKDDKKVEYVIGELEGITEEGSLVGTKADEVREAMVALKETLVNTDFVVDVDSINPAFEYVNEKVYEIVNQIRQKSGDADEYAKQTEEHPFRTFFASGGMVISKFGEGCLSVVEDVGDAAVTITAGWGTYVTDHIGLTDGWNESVSNFIKKDYSNELFSNINEATGINKYSFFTEESGISNLSKGAGIAVGYVTLGNFASGFAGAKSVGSTSKVANFMKQSTNANTVLAAVGGYGSGVENKLLEGKSWGEAQIGGLLNAGFQGGMSYGMGKLGEKIELKNASKAGTVDEVGKVVDKVDKLDDGISRGAPTSASDSALANVSDEVFDAYQKGGAKAAENAQRLEDLSKGTPTNGAPTSPSNSAFANASDEVFEAYRKGGTKAAESAQRLEDLSKKGAPKGASDSALANASDDVYKAYQKGGSKAAENAQRLEDLGKKGAPTSASDSALANASDDVFKAYQKSGAKAAENVASVKSGKVQGWNDPLSVNAREAGAEYAEKGLKNTWKDMKRNITAATTNSSGKISPSRILKSGGKATVNTLKSAGNEASYILKSMAKNPVMGTTRNLMGGVLYAGEANASSQARQIFEANELIEPESIKDRLPQVTDEGILSSTSEADSSNQDSQEKPDVDQHSTKENLKGGDYSTSGGGGGGESIPTQNSGDNAGNAPEQNPGDNNNQDSSSNSSNNNNDNSNNNENNNTNTGGNTNTDGGDSSNGGNNSGGGSTIVTPPSDNGGNGGGGSTTIIGGGGNSQHSGGGFTGSGGFTPGTGTNTDTPVLEETSPLEDSTSSIDDVIKGNKYTKIPTSTKPITTTSTSGGGSAVIPVVAGLSAAAAAGIGAKVYMDRKKNNDTGEDEEIDTEEWSGEDQIELDYADDIQETENYLDDDDDYGYQSEETERYDARSSEELADLQ